jgi:hypothetical protein
MMLNNCHSSFKSLVQYGNIYAIEVFISHNLISLTDLSTIILECCKVGSICSYSFGADYHNDSIIDLVSLLLNLNNIDRSVFQSLLERITSYLSNDKYNITIRKLLEMGLKIPPHHISNLPHELFIEYISENVDMINIELERSCISYHYKDYTNKLKYIHEIAEHQNIPMTNPLDLFKYAVARNNIHVIPYCISRVSCCSELLYKFYLVSCLNAKSRLIENFDTIKKNNSDIIFNANSTLLLLIKTGEFYAHIKKYLDLDVIKYKNIQFDKYFSDNNDYNGFKCPNKEINKIYTELFSLKTSDILDDIKYEDIMRKCSYLIDALDKDERLVDLYYYL